MGEIGCNKIKLMQAKYPALEIGEYKITATQELTKPVKQTLPKAEEVFYVNFPKFTFNLEEIYSVYPPENTKGTYANTLPHIVFNNETLPWTRGKTPWLALICLGSGETPEIKQMTIQDFVKPVMQDEQYAFFENKKRPVFKPDVSFEASTGELQTDLCSYIDLDVETYKSVFPKEQELPYLTHVRIVDMHDKEESVISLNGYFSVAVANRFPVSTEEGDKNMVFLVSLEGYSGYLPAGEKASELDGFDKVRLVCLKSWSFQSVYNSFVGFREAIEKADSAPLAIKTGENSTSAAGIIKKGITPLTHITRTGEQTVSFYHGPLLPYKSVKRARNEKHTADGEIEYDPQYGIFDMAYPAAWQLGRLMALKNKALAKEIFTWRRSINKDHIMRKTKLLLRKKFGQIYEKDTEDGQMKDAGTDSVKQGFMNYWVSELAPQITEDELIATISDKRKAT